MLGKKKMVFEYDIRVPLEKRKQEVEIIMSKHPNKIPIIIQKVETSKLTPPDKFKYLAPPEQSVGQFLYEIRKRLNLTPEQALFIFVGKNVAPTLSASLGEIHGKYKDEDGFLKISFCEENTFG